MHVKGGALFVNVKKYKTDVFRKLFTNGTFWVRL